MKRFLMILLLLVTIVPSSLAQSRALFKDPLLRTDPDPFSKLSSTPSQPLDEKTDAIRYPDLNPAWNDFFQKYGTRKLFYLEGWNKHVLLPGYPSNTSKRTRAELDYILGLQAKRTDQHVVDIRREENNGLDSLGWLLDEHFNLSKMPVTASLFQHALEDVLEVQLILKKKYLRARPSALDPRIKPAIEIPPYPAYPSGHSTQMHVLACICAELKPEGAADFKREAFRVAWDREMAGIHFASDTAAGQLLASQLMDILHANPKFLADLTDAKKEWTEIRMKKAEENAGSQNPKSQKP